MSPPAIVGGLFVGRDFLGSGLLFSIFINQISQVYFHTQVLRASNQVPIAEREPAQLKE